MIGILVMILGFMALVVVGIVLYGVSLYNGLVQVKNNIEKAWANIDVLLKQRSDELPKLLNTVKGYMKHEEGTLMKVTEARTKFLNAQTVSEKAEADNMMTGALKTLFSVSEAYPELKADSQFVHFQTRISSIENEIADRREFYNESVNSYNIRIESIPDMFIARIMNLQKKDMFEVSEQDKQDVEIKFD